MFAATENIMPVISFGPKSSDELATKHNKFIERMVERGYTENRIQLLVAWWTANAKDLIQIHTLFKNIDIVFEKTRQCRVFLFFIEKEESPEHGKYELLLISEILSLTLSGLLIIN